ncbi:MAG: DUF998 domain-containing protein [Thermoanaerobaculia bacterium]
MSRLAAGNDSLVVSYLALRRAIGIVGVALPFVLALGTVAAGGSGIQRSVSAYYYTAMGDVLVGSLCAIGVFLYSYEGYDRRDDIAGNLACLFAVGVALCPTTPASGARRMQEIVGGLHLAFAAALFLTLAYFCLALFRRTDPEATPTPQKLQRNVVYTTCGWTILACIAGIGLLAFVGEASALQRLRPVYWLEATAIVAFGISWLTKGETILADG